MRRAGRAVMLAGLVAAGVSLAGPAWRRALTVSRAQVGTPAAPSSLADFPVLVSVTDPSLRTVSNGGSVLHSSGWDLTFAAFDGTPLAHELERYEPTLGEVVAWVRLPVLNTRNA